MNLSVLIKCHAIVAYYIVVFGISWGAALALFGPGIFLGTTQISFLTASPLTYLAFLAGPAVAGIALVALVHGRAGLRALGSRLLTWRVGVGWYAVALLTAPLLSIATLFALSLISPSFLPVILTTQDKIGLLVSAFAIGIVVPIFEETGWTGFAIPQLRTRYGIVSTGVIAGALWGAWHLPLFTGAAGSAVVIPPALYLVVLLFSWLVPYRVLMVWVYERTKSLLVMMLMHLSIDVGIVLVPASASDAVAATYDLVLAAALWVLVAWVTLGERVRVDRQARQALRA
jgi:membrane protease YdiL (CAAX protease family)